MGLTHHVPDGALLDFAGKLDGAKPLHRFTAWALLVVFGLPVVFALLRLLRRLPVVERERARTPSSQPGVSSSS